MRANENATTRRLCRNTTLYTGEAPRNHLNPLTQGGNAAGSVARNQKALDDIDSSFRYQNTSPETYRVVRALVYGNLKAALDENQV